METTIRIAHSRNSHGFRVYSHEVIRSNRYGACKSGFHVSSADTLDEARADIMRTIEREWRAAGRDVPPIIECGRVAEITGRNYAY